MNKIFKVKYSVERQEMVVVSELANNKNKTASQSTNQTPSFFCPLFTKLTPLTLLVSITLGTSLFSPETFARNVEMISGKVGSSSWLSSQGAKSIALNPKTTSSEENGSTAEDSVAIGTEATTNGAVGSISIGRSAKNEDTGTNGIAIGKNAINRFEKAIVMGFNAYTQLDPRTNNKETREGSVVIGENAKSAGNQSVSLGQNTWSKSNSVSVGAGTFAEGKSTIAIGTDTISGGQYNDSLPATTWNGLGGPPANSIWDIFSGLYMKKQNANTDYNASNRDPNNPEAFYTYSDFKAKYVDNPAASPTYAGKVGAIALGSRTIAAGEMSTAVGSLAFALADKSTAMGLRSFVARNAQGGTAIGEESRTFASNSVAIGNKTEASNTGTMAYGYEAKAVAEGSIAIGSKVAAGALFDVGRSAQLIEHYKTLRNAAKNDTAAEKTALDTFNTNMNSVLTQNGSLSMPLAKDSEVYLRVGGNNITKTATGKDWGSQQAAKNAIVIGSASFATKKNSLAIGINTLSDAENAFALGSYSYVETGSNNSLALGIGAYVKGSNSIVGGTFASASSESGVVLGTKSKIGTNSGSSTVLGSDSSVADNSQKALAVGSGTSVGEQSRLSMALGTGSKIGKKVIASTVLGTDAKIELGNNVPNNTQGSAVGTVDLGGQTTEYIGYAMALGYNATVTRGTGHNETGYNAMAIGAGAMATLENSLALGVNSRTDYTYEQLEATPWIAKGAIAIPTTGRTGVISVGSKGQERRIVNVASGSFDTDAVNVAQLKTLEDRFQSEIALLNNGGGVQYLSVEKENTNGQAGQVAAQIKKSDSYERYVNLKTQQLYIQAREKFNDETFNRDAVQKINDAVTQLEAEYGGELKTTATELNKVATSLQGESKATDLTKLNQFKQQIETASSADSKQNVGGLTQDQIQQLKENNNYLNDGAKGIDSIAFGWKATTSGNNSGNAGKQAIAIGFEASANAQDAISIGTKSNTTETSSIAIGHGAAVTGGGQPSIALGKDSKVTGAASATNSASINGLNFTNFAGNPSTLGMLSVGDSGKERKITNVAAGNVSQTSTEAINGSQLYATNFMLSKVAKSVKDNFGGNANLATDGTITFTNIGGTGQNTIHDAINDVRTKGIYLKADQNDPNGNGQKVELGSAITLSATNNWSNNNVNYKTNNLATYNSRNGTILLGMREDPSVKQITAGTFNTSGDKNQLDGTQQTTLGATGITSSVGSTNYAGFSLGADSVTFSKGGTGTVKLSGVSDATADTDAATLKQVKEYRTKLVGDNDITATDRSGGSTNAITYNLSLNKGTVSPNENKVVSGQSVYNAIKGAKPTVSAEQNKGIKVTGTKSDDITGNSFTIGLDDATLNKINNAANQDLSNLSENGKNAITGLVDVVKEANSPITVQSSTDNNKKKTFTVGVDFTDTITEGNTADDKKLTTAKSVETYVTNKLANFSTDILLSDGRGGNATTQNDGTGKRRLSDGFTIKSENFSVGSKQYNGSDSLGVMYDDQNGIFKLSLDMTALTTSLANTFAKLDASNLTDDGNKGKWRTALNVYSKTEADAEIQKSKVKLMPNSGLISASKQAGTGNDGDTWTLSVNSTNKIEGTADGSKLVTDKAVKDYVAGTSILLTQGDNDKSNSSGRVDLSQKQILGVFGNDDITTNATGTTIKFSLNKATAVEESNQKAVTSSAVYSAIKSAKPTVSVKQGESILKVEGAKTDGITGDTFNLSLDQTALKNALTTDFAKVDASNVAGNAEKWRKAIDVYSKAETNDAIKQSKVTLTPQNGLISATKTTAGTGNQGDTWTLAVNSTDSIDKNNATGGKLVTDKAVKDYVAQSSILRTMGNNSTGTATGQVDLSANQILNVSGANNGADISTNATGNNITLSLNKATSITDSDTKAATSKAVYEAVKAAKASIQAATGGIITVSGSKGDNINSDTWTIGVNYTSDNQIGTNPTGSKLATDLAVKNAVDGAVDKVKTLRIAGDASSSGQVDLSQNQVLGVKGTANQIETTAAGNNITLKLSDTLMGKIDGKVDKTDYQNATNITASKWQDALSIAYKANNDAQKTVSLTKGLAFTDGTNTTAEVGEEGVVKFTLKENLTGLKTIATESLNASKNIIAGGTVTVGGETEGIVLTKSGSGNDRTLSLSGAGNAATDGIKVSGVKAGEAETDAVNKGQLDKLSKAINDALGTTDLAVTKDPNQTSIFDPINGTAPTTFKDAVDKLTTAVNTGWGLKVGSTNKNIGAGKTVTVAGSNGITANLSNDDSPTLTIGLETTTFNTTNPANISATDTGDKFATAANVASAINAATAGLSQTLKFKANGDNTDQELNLKTQTLEFNKDANLTVSSTGTSVTYGLSNNITLGDSTNAGQITIKRGAGSNPDLVIGKDGKITGLANGSIATDSSDAVNGGQIRSILGVDPNSNIGGTSKTNINEAIKEVKDQADKLAATNLQYKATNAQGTTKTDNQTPAKEQKGEVSLTTGLDFRDGKNTTSEVSDNGVVKYHLNETLDDMNTINFKAQPNQTNKAKLNADGLVIAADPNNISTGNYTALGKDGVTLVKGDSTVKLADDGFSVKNATSESKLGADKLTLGKEGEEHLEITKDTISAKNGSNGKSGINFTESTVTLVGKDGTNGTNSTAKLTGLSDGAIGADSKDAINGKQIYDVLGFDPATKKNESGQGIGGTSSKTVDGAIKEVKDSVTNATLKYTANSGATKKEVKLSEGLDFVNGDNTTASVEDNGKVKVSLNTTLNEMDTIKFKAKTNDKAALSSDGLVFDDSTTAAQTNRTTFAKDGVTLEKDGSTVKVAKDGFAVKDATSQSKVESNKLSVGDVAGNAFGDHLEVSKTGISRLGGADKDIVSMTLGENAVTLAGKDSAAVALKGVSSALGLTAGATAVEKATAQNKMTELLAKTNGDLNTAVNLADLQAVAQAGLDFAGNSGESHRTLGSKLNVKGEGNVTGTTAADNITVEASTDTLTIKLSNNITNISSIGGGKKTNPNTEEKAKITFEDDSLKVNDKTLTGVKSALDNVQVPGGSNPPTTLEKLAKAAEDKTNGGASSVVNVKDLSDVATALTDKGLSFVGDDSQQVDRKLGETLKLIGGANKDQLSDGNNIGVTKDTTDGTLKLRLAKDLSQIASIAFDTAGGVTGKISSEGTVFTKGDKNNGGETKTTFGVDGVTIDNTKTAADGTEAKTTLVKVATDGFSVTDGNSESKLGADKLTIGKSGEDHLEITKDTITAKNGADGKSSIKLTENTVTLVGKDGNNATAKLTGVSNGSMAAGSNDAVNGGQINKILGFDPAELEKPNGSKTGIGGTTSKTIDGAIEEVKNSVVNAELTYRANNATDDQAKKVKLSKGLNFKDGTNTAATVDDNGVVTYSLNATLNAMDTINFAAKNKNNATLNSDGLVFNSDPKDGNHTTFAKDGVTLTRTAKDGTVSTIKVAEDGFSVKAVDNTGAVQNESKLGADKLTIGTPTADHFEVSKTGISRLGGADKDIVSMTLGDKAVTLAGKDSAAVALKGVSSALGLSATTVSKNDAKTKVEELLKKNNTELNTAVNLADLQAVAQSGFDFAGNSGNDIHRTLGTKLTIKGEGTLTGDTAADNLTVVSDGTDTLTVKLSKNLTNINSIGGGNTTAGAEKAKITFEDDKLKVNDKTLTGVKSALDGVQVMDGNNTPKQNPTILEKLDAAAKDTTNGGASSVVNVKDLSDVATALTDKGLSFVGDDSQKVDRKLGETLKLTGGASTNLSDGANIGVTKDTADGTLKLRLAKALSQIASVAFDPTASGVTGKISSDGTVFTKGDKANGGETTTTFGIDGVTIDNTKTVDGADVKTNLVKVATDGFSVKQGENESKLSPTKLSIGKETGSHVEVTNEGISLKDNTADKSSIKLGTDAITLAGNAANQPIKLTGVANGSMAANSNDVVNGGQINKILGFDPADFDKQTDPKTGIGGTNAKTIEGAISALNNKKLKYIASDANGTQRGNDREVDITDGLNFKDGKNTTASVDANGVVQYALNDTLNEMDTINFAQQGGTGDKAKLNANGLVFAADPNNIQTGDATVFAKDGVTLTRTATDGVVSTIKVAEDGFSVKKVDGQGAVQNESKLGADKLTIGTPTADHFEATSTGIARKNGTANISSIELGTDAITLAGSNSTDGITLKGVKGGEISSTSKEAINGTQLNDLGATVLGATVNDGKDGFKAPEFAAINGKKDKPTTFKAAIDQLIESMNSGINLKGSNSTDAHKALLGSTITIKQGDYTDNGTQYKGENLSVTLDNDSQTFTVAMKKDPRFDTVKVGTDGENQLVINGSEISSKVKGTDGTVSDGAKVTLGKDEITLSKGTGNDPVELKGVASAIDKITKVTKDDGTENNNPTVLEKLEQAAKDGSSSVVNVKDLNNVAKAVADSLTEKGLTFADDNGTEVKRKLGETLTVKGGVQETKDSNADKKLTDNNIGVVSDAATNALVVKLAKQISDITSIATNVNGESKSVFDTTGLTVTGLTKDNTGGSSTESGAKASYGLDGVSVKDVEGNTSTTTATSTQFVDKYGKTSMQTASGMVTADDEHTSVLTAKSMTLTGKDGHSQLTANELSLEDNEGNNSVQTAAGTRFTSKDGDITAVTGKGVMSISPDNTKTVSLSSEGIAINNPNGGVNITPEGFGFTGPNSNQLRTDAPRILSTGIDAGHKKISNVADGDISPNSGDVVTGRQLYALMQKGITVYGDEVKPANASATNTAPAGNTAPTTAATPTTPNVQGENAQNGTTAANAGGNTATAGNTATGDIAPTQPTLPEMNTALVDDHLNVPLGGSLNIHGDHNVKTTVSADNRVGISLQPTISIENNLLIGSNDPAKANLAAQEGNALVIANKDNGSAALVFNNEKNMLVLSDKDAKPRAVLDGQNGALTLVGNDDSQVTLSSKKGKDIDGNDLSRLSVTTERTNADGQLEKVETSFATMDDGLKFKADGDKVVNKKLNETVEIVGDENVTTSITDDNKVKVSLNKKIAIDEVKIPNTDPDAQEGDSIVINNGGIHAGNKVITGVKASDDPTSAVNRGQLNTVIDNVQNNFNQVHQRIGSLTRESRAGIAGAMATASLQNVTLPGKTTISVGTATFKGENAVAIGVSKLSDNGKIGIRLSGMSTSDGDTGAAMSVGFTF